MTMTPETKNGPEVAPASNDFGTANPTATNQKGTAMSTSHSTESHRCPPWCDHTMRAQPDEEHEAHCVSREMSCAEAVDNYARRLHLGASVTHQRDLPTARSRVRLMLHPRDNDREAEALAMTPAQARSLASTLCTVADVAEGLRALEAEHYELRLNSTAAALADQADAAFEAGDESLSIALDAAAAKLRVQAVRR